LLSGAKEAIRKGAPDVAEHALASALPGLEEPELTEAKFLLVEVLQEQGRWLESLDLLATLKAHATSERTQEALVLTEFAKIHLGTLSTQEMYQRFSELLKLAHSGPDPRMRAKAARAAAWLVGAARSVSAAEELLRVVDQIPETELDPDSLGTLSLAKAMLLYHLRRTSESWAHVNTAILTLKQRGAANLVMVQLQLGVGSIRSREGRYSDATVYLESALQMAMRLGNDTHITHVAGNLALCYSRLGRHSDQLQLITKVPAPSGSEFAGFAEMQYAYSTAISNAIFGRRSKAYQVLEELDSRLRQQIPRWMIQAWRLWKADVLMLIGKPNEAHISGRSGTAEFGYELSSFAFAGPFARWICLTAKRELDKDTALGILESITHRLDELDALDQVEVLRAHRALARDTGDLDVGDLLKRKEVILPKELLEQLTQFEGAVDFGS
jgi:tetratricopeptide (TPR) repeat protein